MQLNYKAINIKNAEDRWNINFIEDISNLEAGNVSMTRLINVLLAGGMEEEEAGEFIDKNGLLGAVKQAMKAVADAGFLANITDEEATEAVQATSSTASQSTGKSTKA